MTQTATNPDTGERLALIGGEWKPFTQSATGPSGEKAFLVGDQWVTDQSSAQTPKPEPIKPTLVERTTLRGEKVSEPSLLGDIVTGIANVATGASGLMRGTANLLSGGARLGDVIWPKAIGSQGTIAKTAGELADPAALAVGGVIGKVVPYAPVLGQGVVQGIKAVSKNLASGALTGGTVGGLSDEGSVLSGAAAGAVANQLLPPAFAKAAQIWDVISGRYGAVQAGKILRAAAGGDRTAINAVTALAPKDIHTTQATAGLNNDVWNALGQLAKEKDVSSFFSRMEAQQAANRQDAMARIAGGPTQELARDAAEQTRKSLNAVTGGMRETELAAANTGGTVGRRLAAETDALGGVASSKVADVRRLEAAKDAAERVAQSGRGTLAAESAPVGQPRLSGKYSYGQELSDLAELMSQKAASDSLILGQAARFKQGQLDSLAAHGLKPLDTNAIINNMSRKLNDPSIAGNDLAEKVISNVGNTIKRWTDKGGGVIDAEALYAIRKNAVNQEIDRLMGGVDPKVKQKYATQLLTTVKPAIDDAIISAGGSGWMNYLNTFERGMRNVERQQMGAKALELLNRGKGQKKGQKFESLVAGNEPKMVEKIFKTTYSLEGAMGQKDYATMRGIAEELARDRSIAEGATRGRGGMERILQENLINIQLPNWISRNVAVTNKALSMAESGINKSTMDKIYAAMRSGKNASEAINVLPTEERLAVAKKIFPYINQMAFVGGISEAAGSTK